MDFTIHSRWKTGEISEKTRTVEGPNYRGFMLEVSLQEGLYQGAAVVPQTLDRPYWKTYIDAINKEDSGKHLWVSFSYGGRIDQKFFQAIFKSLPQSVLAKNHARHK